MFVHTCIFPSRKKFRSFSFKCALLRTRITLAQCIILCTLCVINLRVYTHKLRIIIKRMTLIGTRTRKKTPLDEVTCTCIFPPGLDMWSRMYNVYFVCRIVFPQCVLDRTVVVTIANCISRYVNQLKSLPY